MSGNELRKEVKEWKRKCGGGGDSDGRTVLWLRTECGLADAQCKMAKKVASDSLAAGKGGKRQRSSAEGQLLFKTKTVPYVANLVKSFSIFLYALPWDLIYTCFLVL